MTSSLEGSHNEVFWQCSDKSEGTRLQLRAEANCIESTLENRVKRFDTPIYDRFLCWFKRLFKASVMHSKNAYFSTQSKRNETRETKKKFRHVCMDTTQQFQIDKITSYIEIIACFERFST